VTRAVVLALAALGAALAGCGDGAGEPPDQVGLAVTRDFGTRDIASAPQPRTAASDTVMRLLQRNVRPVTTRDRGRFVQSIAGVAGGRVEGRPFDWFFYVNGLLGEEGAAAVRVNPGDRVWWDHRERGVTPTVPAVVGSFPEPFLHGTAGRRLPVRIECIEPEDPACDIVAMRLGEAGVVAGRGGINAGDNLETLRVLVGPWPALRDRDQAAEQLDQGPARSGVYVRFDAAGRRLTVLDPRGGVARRLGGGTGLIAATRLPERAATWFVTGTDDAGVRSAANALQESALAEAYALAVSEDRGVRAPEVAP
jgi:hypothetical protein